MRRLGDFIFRFPRAVILVVFVVALIAVYPAWQIRTDFNLEGFYPQDDRVLADYRLLEEEFGRDDNTILIGFETDDLFSRDVLLDLKAMTDRLTEIPHVESIRSLWSARQMVNIDDRLEFSPYLTEAGLDDIDFPELRRDLLSDPFVSGLLLSPDGTATAIVIDIRDDDNTYEIRNRVISGMDEILSGFPYEFKISGIPYYRNQYVNLLNDEIIIYIIVSSLLIISLLFMLYRSALGVLLPMLIVWTTLLLTVALMQLTGGYLEIMSSTIAPILLCVGVADAVHMISKYDDARYAGMNKRNGIKEMLITLGSATFLTSITTAIGFASLTSSSVVPMQRFGIYTALGVLVAYLITILFLPASLRLSSRKKVFNENKTRIYPVIGRFLEKVSGLNRLHYRSVIAATGLIVIVFASGMLHLKVDGRVFDDLSEDSRLIQDSRFFSERLAPPFPMEIILDTGVEEGIFDPEFIRMQDRLERYLAEYDEVERIISTHTLLKQIHRTLDPGSESAYPESVSRAAQYFLLLEMNEDEQIGQLADFDYRTARFTILLEDAGSNRINLIRDDIEEWLNYGFGTDTNHLGNRQTAHPDNTTDRMTTGKTGGGRYVAGRDNTAPAEITRTTSGLTGPDRISPSPYRNVYTAGQNRTKLTGYETSSPENSIKKPGHTGTSVIAKYAAYTHTSVNQESPANRETVRYTITGTTILSADLTEKIVYSIFWSILLAVTAISLVMAWMFRSTLLVLISMIPNLVPLVMVAGILGWFGLDIKPSTAVIFTIALGIAVDDSIHYLARFRIEYIRSGNMSDALHKTTVKTGRAIIITSLIIMAGFGSLLTSEFTSTVLMGLLVGITIFSALIADLLLLPSLFYWIKPKFNIRKDGFEPPELSGNEFRRETEKHPV